MFIPAVVMSVWLYSVMPRYVGPRRDSYLWWCLGSLVWLGVFFVATNEMPVSRTGSIAFGLAAPALGALGAIDLAVHRLPRLISNTTFALVATLLIVGSRFDLKHGLSIFAGASLMLLLIASMRVISRGSLGRGDVHLAPLLGALIGWFDPYRILLASLVMAMSAAVVAGVLVISHRRERSDFIPYGPFMLFGAAVAILGSRGGH